MAKKIIVITVLSALLLACLFTVQFCKPSPKTGEPTTMSNNAFVGDQACKSCHAKAYDEWKQSDHFKAMEQPQKAGIWERSIM